MMNDAATAIKSMKLYSHIERIYNELNELGKAESSPLNAEELSTFDQLHYHGTAAVDHAAQLIGIKQNDQILEVGSGFGGPARHLATITQAHITALELQPDQNQLAQDLTTRCGLRDNVSHIAGDYLSHDFKDQQFNAIVSWLAIYHIPNRPRLIEISHNLLSHSGYYYAEDMYCRNPFNQTEFDELKNGLYASHLPNFETYQAEFEQGGFQIELAEDVSKDWTEFTTARLADYRDNKARHILVHDEATYQAMEHFYDLVNRHFRSGKLGGIRFLARKF